MSSLAAARADGFYYPPDFDPKNGGLNKQQGQHPLRERAKKLDQGILVIRFEMPFNVWCAGCNHLIGKGVRFNAEKKAVGNYHSTKIWSFVMKAPCCGQRIEVRTDPKNTEYVVVEGGRRKVEEFTAADAETIELPDEEERAALADPFTRLETGGSDRARGLAAAQQLDLLRQHSSATQRHDYQMNKALRRQLRGARKEDAARDAHRAALGLPEDVKLLPESAQDAEAAALVAFGSGEAAFSRAWQQRRRVITQTSIFAGPAAAKPSSSSAGSLAAGTRAGLKPPAGRLAGASRAPASRLGLPAGSGVRKRTVADKAALARRQLGVRLALSDPVVART